MLQTNPSSSYILISSDIEVEFERLKKELSPNRVIGFIDEKFKLELAKEVVAEAYISESTQKYLVLGSLSFGTEAQNSLLKILEEPPRNIVFIIISPTKSNLLPTIRSRLPIIKGRVEHKEIEIEFDLSRLNYSKVFDFLKQNSYASKDVAKGLVEAIYFRATKIDKLILTQDQLDNFDKAHKLLELNARTQSVLATVLMGFASVS